MTRKLVLVSLGIFLSMFWPSVPVLGLTGLCNEQCRIEEQSSRSFGITYPFTHNEEILEYQQVLKKAGFFQGTPNGIFGLSTEEAVKRFQQAAGLIPDGVVGPKTKEMLSRMFEAGETAGNTQPSAPQGKVKIVVSIPERKLTVYDGDKVFKTFRVAVGKNETPTPIGEWKIARKARDWGTGFGTRWMGLNVPWGIYGIHGTNKPGSIGSYASHGCIRMFNRDVEKLYEWVKVDTEVIITGQVYSPYYERRPAVFKGCRGSEVMLVQKGLIAEGYLQGPVDGIFGTGTENALKKLQKDKGFEVTGQVTADIWPVLGL